MEDETQQRDNEADLAGTAAIQARFSTLVTTLAQARTELKDLRRFLEDCDYGDQLYLADLGVCEIYVARMKKYLAHMSEVYKPEKGKGYVHSEREERSNDRQE